MVESIGLVTPEQQMLKMARRSNDWIRRDFPELSKWDLEQHRRAKEMVVASMVYKTLFSLYRHPFTTLFLKHKKHIGSYRNQPHCDKEGNIESNEVIYVNGVDERDGSTIELRKRCPKRKCIAHDF